MESITIRAFRAVDDPASCTLFVREHTRVLEEFGIGHVATGAPTWVTDPDVYVIVAESDQLGMIGGARIHISRGMGGTLPIESALEKLDPQFGSAVDALRAQGVGEICGLWNANRFNGRGLPVLLGMAATSISNQLNIGCMLGLVAKYTLKYALRLGYGIMEDVGTSGIFDNYPRPGFLGIVIRLNDVSTMERSRPAFRRRMISLRLRPNQQVVEDTGVAQLNVCYDLVLKQDVIDIGSYTRIEEDRLRYTG